MLSNEEKAGLRPHLDLEALERLLGALAGLERDAVIRFFSRLPEEYHPRGHMVGGSVPQPAFATPQLQALFDKVSEPERLIQREHLRKHYPAHWKDVERKFALVERVANGRNERREATIHRRPADQGGDVIELPAGAVDFDAIASSIDTLMSERSVAIGSTPSVSRITLSQTPPSLSDEATRLIGDFPRLFVVAPHREDGGIAGRWIDAWLLGSP